MITTREDFTDINRFLMISKWKPSGRCFFKDFELSASPSEPNQVHHRPLIFRTSVGQLISSGVTKRKPAPNEYLTLSWLSHLRKFRCPGCNNDKRGRLSVSFSLALSWRVLSSQGVHYAFCLLYEGKVTWCQPGNYSESLRFREHWANWERPNLLTISWSEPFNLLLRTCRLRTWRTWITCCDKWLVLIM